MAFVGTRSPGMFLNFVSSARVISLDSAGVGEREAFPSDCPFVTCVHALAVKRVPFQSQMRVFVPPLGQQRGSPSQ